MFTGNFFLLVKVIICKRIASRVTEGLKVLIVAGYITIFLPYTVSSKFFFFIWRVYYKYLTRLLG